ncbi:hypothetical protein GMORB2_5997 [Geosmithia morbida]|uniref:Uncharacterized protein n=1 Tax=Geosmithia morbida TaxID=1094350 RepID=A0A9P4YWA9_9HYPO|nr:uncharacterized protein GMORB2_5997 [Geosmithia morbida]KAF4124281.1 hypothetical protein GMORB2_5997 [Geosmithia morbida]
MTYDTYRHFHVTTPAPGVSHVEINRPEKINAFSKPMWLECGRLFDQLSSDADVRAVVLSGAGTKGFSAGLDVQGGGGDLVAPGGEGVDATRKAKFLRGFIEDFQRCIGAIERCEKPVIGVMHGIAYGLAIDIACCADVRICTSDVRFSVKEVDIGMPADIGTLARLPKIVGSLSWVKDVCMTARVFDAEEALRQGFVSAVYRRRDDGHGGEGEAKEEAVRAAVGMATLLAGKSPVAVQGTKELLNHGREHTTAEALRYTAVWNSVAVQGDDMAKGLGSALARTTPRFSKL